MNRMLFRLTAVIAVAMFSMSAWAQTFEVGGIYYEVDASNTFECCVTKHPSGYSKNSYLIPNIITYNSIDYSVTSIKERAFYNCESLVEISLPNTIRTISERAFYGCKKLKTINIPTSTKFIGVRALYGCATISSIQLPDALETIMDEAFSGTNVEKITIPRNVNCIKPDAFSDCSNLYLIQVDANNTTYDSRMDCNAICKGDTLVLGCKASTVPYGITVIGKRAFSDCSQLGKSILPNSVTSILERAFYNCESLVEIVLPSTIRTISERAFYGCKKLSQIELPDSIQNICMRSFAECTSLTSIEIPSSVDTIENEAFYNCNNLIEIVSNVESPFVIGDKVFYDYSNLVYDNTILFVPKGKVEKYRNTAGWSKFVNIQEIEPDPMPVIDNKTYVIHKRTGLADLQTVVSDEYVIVPETIEHDGKNYTVTRILDSAFEGSNMISLSIPSSVTYIGQNAIKDCSQLAAIDWNPTFKPSDEFVSNIVNPNLLFYTTSEQYAPNGIRNVVVGGQASSITLTDETYGNFYCLRAFTADNIIYTHNYSLPTEKGLAQGWETIVLPFDVITIQTASGDVIKPVTIAEDGVKRFWLKELSETGLKEASQINANVPYIISMPNWDGYQDFYNITGDVTFSAQNVTVEATDIHPVTSGAYNFYPSFQTLDKSDDYWAINKEEYDGNAPGSVFVSDLRTIKPFEAYFTKDSPASARRCISIADMMEGTTAIADILVRGERTYSDNGIIYIESAADGNCNIYSMSGQLLRKLALKKGTNTVSGLTRGIYIVNGNKVLVK